MHIDIRMNRQVNLTGAQQSCECSEGECVRCKLNNLYRKLGVNSSMICGSKTHFQYYNGLIKRSFIQQIKYKEAKRML
jgi:hypothetical protein